MFAVQYLTSIYIFVQILFLGGSQSVPCMEAETLELCSLLDRPNEYISRVWRITWRPDCCHLPLCDWDSPLRVRLRELRQVRSRSHQARLQSTNTRSVFSCSTTTSHFSHPGSGHCAATPPVTSPVSSNNKGSNVSMVSPELLGLLASLTVRLSDQHQTAGTSKARLAADGTLSLSLSLSLALWAIARTRAGFTAMALSWECVFIDNP